MCIVRDLDREPSASEILRNKDTA